MTISLNNTQQHIETGISIATLLHSKAITRQGIAIAVNNTVIPKAQWEQTLLQENDHVTIIQATQGG